MFTEDNTIEQMVLATLKTNGWKYVEAEKLPRHYSDVMVEPMVRDALIRLNPEIAEDPSRADTVIYKLRTLILSVQPHNLVTQNEIFKKLIFEENSYPFGKDGRMIPIRFFGTMTKENLALNEYIVTNQWVYPMQEGGHRFDIVLLINGFPIAIEDLGTAKAYGLDALIQIMEQALPDELIDTLQNVQIASLKAKKLRAQAAVATASLAAAGEGAAPIPFADCALLIPTQLGMIASITVIFGFDVNKSIITALLSSTIGTGGATLLGKTVVSNILKLIPGAGTVAGGAISAGTAGVITAALGEAYIGIMELVFKGDMGIDDLSTKKGKETMSQMFKEQLKSKKA